MITRLSLRNFKCFEEQSFDLAPLSLLTGLNGMGKSSVLQALLLVRQSARAGLLPMRGLLLAGEYVTLGSAGDALYDGARGDDPDAIGLRVELAGIGGLVELRLDASDRQSDFLPVRGSYQWPLEPTALLGRPINALEHASRVAGPSCHYVAAERIGPRDIHALSRHEVRERDLGHDGSNTVAFLDTHASQVVEAPLRRDDAASAQLASQVTAWLGEISPGVRISTTSHQELSRASSCPTLRDASCGWGTWATTCRRPSTEAPSGARPLARRCAPPAREGAPRARRSRLEASCTSGNRSAARSPCSRTVLPPLEDRAPPARGSSSPCSSHMVPHGGTAPSAGGARLGAGGGSRRRRKPACLRWVGPRARRRERPPPGLAQPLVRPNASSARFSLSALFSGLARRTSA